MEGMLKSWSEPIDSGSGQNAIGRRWRGQAAVSLPADLETF